MAEQRTVQELEQAKAEAERQVQEIEESLSATEKDLAKQAALVDSLTESLDRKEAMKKQDVLLAEKRRAELTLSQKKRLLPGYDELIQEQVSRSAADHSKTALEKEIASRRERAKLFDRASGEIAALGETMRKIFAVGQDPKFIPPVLAGQAGVLAERYRVLAEQERLESDRLESKLES